MNLWDKALEFLVSTIGQSAVDSWPKRADVTNDLSNLRWALPKARLLIERSECWRLPKYNPIDDLLSQLKDSVYDAESIVDELEYQILKNKVQKSLPGINFLRNWVENWMSDFPNTVKRVLDRLNKAYNEMKEICDSHGIPENPNRFSQTAIPITRTFLDTLDVYGRDKELNEVIRLIIMGVPGYGSHIVKRARKLRVTNLDIGESSSRKKKKRNLSVISIVGMGGVGKTTLAQMVCDDTSVKSYFELIMWVSVSDNFDLVRLTKEVIDSATKEDCNLTNLHAMQVTLHETLNSKRFLLVLDDVRSKDWQFLLAPMEGASKGSVVLLTTRSLECVEIPAGTSIGSRSDINLEGLKEDIYWVFFKSWAFDLVAESNDINPELEVIGKEICSKLKGSLLAAKTIRGVLRTNLEVRHWKNINDSKMWQLQKEEHDIVPVLKLSYQYLPSYLKKCFSFFSLYPKGFIYTRSELTKFWIMQGLIGPLDNFHQLTTLADGYFHDLVSRCFFQIYKRGTNNEDDKYVIHDLMHDVCQSITKDECFCIEDGHPEQKASLDIRHVSVFRKNLKLKEQNELCKYKKLLSLEVAAFTNSCCIKGIKAWCNELTNIRSLYLARCKIKKLPKNIGNLKHLQFLDISGTNIEMLPESFCSLYNLQYLNMHDCSNIKYFPEGFNNLVNLLLLRLPLEKVSLVEHIENIFEAIQLYDLTVVVAHQKIENLKNISKLSGSLKICDLENVPNKNVAEEAQLSNKTLINHLDLSWKESRLDTNEDHDEEVLDGLCPHPNLRELRITHYKGRNLSPSWLKEEFLPNLKVVFFFECRKASTISPLPCSITKLTLWFCTQLISLQDCLEPNRLPMLKHIEIIHCWELESLSVELFVGFVSLEWLKICNCPNLRNPNSMVLPPTVKCLDLTSCGDVEKSIPSCLQNLTSLETLTIAECEHLVSVPAEVTSNLKSLSKVRFQDCTKLQSLWGLLSLESLQDVTIINCPNLDETRGENLYGPSEVLEIFLLLSQSRKRRKGQKRSR